MALGVGQDQASPAASTHRRVVELEGGGQHLGFLVVVLLLIQLLPEPRHWPGLFQGVDFGGAGLIVERR